ncbi:MAG: ClpXP protease specificity-enhancing factor SspB [Litorimonas sp.]
MSQDLMNYEQMTQLALRGVVRDAIRRVIREDGLPGAHHFYITFLTRYPGVEIDESLAGKYPEEITIVIEHQFWDLNAHADEFEVTLKFGGIPKYLKVPYHAITRFHDPSVGFALQFDAPVEMEPQDSATIAQITAKTSTKPALKTKGAAKPTAIGAAKAKAKDTTSDKAADTKAKKAKDGASPEGDKKDNAEKVVSLDAFRKK